MDSGFSLRISDVLQRPLFRNAYVAAGISGVNSRVRWVHVLEVTSIDALIHGEEMILTTGVGFHTANFSYTSYLQKLAELNVSCLCLQLGWYLDEVPEEMMEAANRLNFPLIVFTEEVRFVDITQDINTLIINRHYAMLKDLEQVSREFHRSTLTSQGTSSVLKLLHKSTNAQIVYLPVQGQPTFIPHVHAGDQKELLRDLYGQLNMRTDPVPAHSPYHWLYADKTVLFQPVGAMGQTWAYIVVIREQEPNEYHYLVLDSASISIAQDLLRKRYIDERKLHTENVWVDDLLHGRLKDDEHLQSLIGSDYQKLNDMSHRVCLFEIDPFNDLEQTPAEDPFESDRFHLSLTLRNIFEQHGFRPFIHMKNNRIVVIALSSDSKSSKKRLQQMLEAIRKIKPEHIGGELQIRVGVGQSYNELKNAPRSYQEAIKALMVYPSMTKSIVFYDDIGIFQLLVSLREGQLLETFVHNHLSPLIEEDKSKGSKLLYTLKVYLDHNGSKQLAAKQLFLVRQSLYYRLEKIKELLGEDFMSTERRLTLQVAILAYQLLHPHEFSERE